MLNFLFGGSRTITLAMTILMLLSRGFDTNKDDKWLTDSIREMLPGGFKERATTKEFNQLISTGKAFIKAVYAVLHKD